MKSFQDIHGLLLEQRGEFLRRDLGTVREELAEIKTYKNTPFPVVISGLRRAGKSTLLAQLARSFYPKGEYFFVDFEDERFLSFTVADFAKLHELLIGLFGDRKIFLFDEIQNIAGWERFVNRMAAAGYKFYITGSNASLLSKELGTKLTGRYLPVELFPFSFKEYLRFKKITLPDVAYLTTVNRGKLKNAFLHYLKSGGIPQALQYPRLPIHKTMYDDIINRDVATRYKIAEIKPLKELAFYLLGNIASLASYNKLKELLRLGSVNTISGYIDYLSTAWLIFVVNRYAFSVKQQQIANKKIYAIDTGLTKSVAFSFSEDKGKFLENAVFLHLRRRWGEDIFYYKTARGGEVDFYLPKKKMFIQVSQSLTDPETREREQGALAEALGEVKGSSGLIITEDEKDIGIIPAYEWLLTDGVLTKSVG